MTINHLDRVSWYGGSIALGIVWAPAFLRVLQSRFGKRICISAVEGARSGSFPCVGTGHGLMGYEFRAANYGRNLFLNVSRKSGDLRGNRAHLSMLGGSRATRGGPTAGPS